MSRRRRRGSFALAALFTLFGAAAAKAAQADILLFNDPTLEFRTLALVALLAGMALAAATAAQSGRTPAAWQVQRGPRRQAGSASDGREAAGAPLAIRAHAAAIAAVPGTRPAD